MAVGRFTTRRKKKESEGGAPPYMVTYGDMVTLLLTFFILLLSSTAVNIDELRLILASFPGLGQYYGGNTLEKGRLAELGNDIESLPSLKRGRSLDESLRVATSIFQPEISSRQVRVVADERGVVISLAGNVFFESSSATLRLEQSRGILQKLAQLLSSDELSRQTFRLEGHTDSIPTDPEGEWESNWELSTARSLEVLRYITELGVNEQQLQVMGLSDTQPLYSDDTAEGRAFNRRIDIVILSEGHL